jgi:hypothetical protein
MKCGEIGCKEAGKPITWLKNATNGLNYQKKNLLLMGMPGKMLSFVAVSST